MACVAVNKPDFQLFHPSASLSVCPAGLFVPACGRRFVVNVHFHMRECIVYLSSAFLFL